MLFLFSFFFTALINKSCISNHDHDMRSYLQQRQRLVRLLLGGGGRKWLHSATAAGQLASF
jgi:hypothetical protein